MKAGFNEYFITTFKKAVSLFVLASLCLGLLSGCGAGSGKKGEVAQQIYFASTSSGRETAEIFVEPIEGLDGECGLL